MRRRKLKPYKISRGSLEEQQLREDNHLQTQRALLFILPVVMIAVLAVGLFFGYKGYQRQLDQIREIEHATTVPEETEPDPMFMSIVSSAYPLTAEYVPPLTDFSGVQVSPDMTESLSEMLSAASGAGLEIVVQEGYISYEEQKERYSCAVEDYRKRTKSSVVKAEAAVRKTTPREGECEQQSGYLIYLTAEGDGKFENTPEYSWLIKNCVSYGFILRYPDKENAGGLSFSPHLFRYVGAENAYYITAYDMSFDEYVAYRMAQ